MSRDRFNPPDQTAAKRADELERMCRALGGAEASCDEITRARAEARLEAALAAAPAGTTGRRADARWWRGSRVAGLVMAAAAVILVAGIGIGRWRSPHAPAPAVPALALTDTRFEPYVVSPAGADGLGATVVPGALTLPASRLDVPKGWLVRARVSAAARVTIVGPARVSVTEDAAVVRLHVAAGKLLGELVPGGGRTLEIVTPDSTITVVGTLFSVEAGAPASFGGASRATRVSVAHGRVRVTVAAGTREIGGGESWLTSEKEAVRISDPDRAKLDEHHLIDAPVGPAVPLEVEGAPAGADVWFGETRVAPAPAWLRVDARAVVRLSAPGHTDTIWHLPVAAADKRAAADGVERPWRLAMRAATGSPTVAPTSKALQDRPAAPAPQLHRASAARPNVAPGKGDTAGPPSEEPVVEPDAVTLYHEADRAFAAGDRQKGRAALRELIVRYPRDRLADDAHYELAVMDHASGADAEALEELAAIRGGPRGIDEALGEPVLYLRCRVLVAQRSAAADACLVSFRERYPRSAHAIDALGTLAALRLEREGCAAAAPLIDELARSAPEHPARASWRRGCAASSAGTGSRP